MDITLFISLIIFPFGQLIKLNSFINPIDILVLISAFYVLINYKKYSKPEYFKYLEIFLIFLFFTWLGNINTFGLAYSMKGLLYILRFVGYSYFIIYVFNKFVTDEKINRVLNGLSIVGFYVAIFGWIQYIAFPDLRALMFLGWDDHYYRLVGTFLDPTYTSIILALSAILASYRKKHILAFFLIFTLAFTYSRAGFISVVGGLLYFILRRVDQGKNILLILLFLLTVVIVPKDVGGEGVNLKRTFSVNKRIVNYAETLRIFRESPVVGVGFNNLCIARNKYLSDTNTASHSCSGSDSSVIFILTTTGVVGLMLFINYVLHLPFNPLLNASLITIFIHSFFANTFFYPFVMFWMTILIGLRREINLK